MKFFCLDAESILQLYGPITGPLILSVQLRCAHKLRQVARRLHWNTIQVESYWVCSEEGWEDIEDGRSGHSHAWVTSYFVENGPADGRPRSGRCMDKSALLLCALRERGLGL